MNLGEVILSINRAILDRVTPNLRGVTCTLNENHLKVSYIFHEQPSELEEELIDDADTEVIADFSRPGHETEMEILHLPFPQKFPDCTRWIYKRYEERFDE